MLPVDCAFRPRCTKQRDKHERSTRVQLASVRLMRVGEAELTPILELEAGLVPVAGLCYGWDPTQIGAQAEWLYPRHVDPVTGMARLSHHSWLLRTGESHAPRRSLHR